jgi:hypothetical protein
VHEDVLPVPYQFLQVLYPALVKVDKVYLFEGRLDGQGVERTTWD